MSTVIRVFAVLTIVLAGACSKASAPPAESNTEEVARGEEGSTSTTQPETDATTEAGGDWTTLELADLKDSGYNSLTGIDASSASDVWAVGSQGSFFKGAALVQHFDGSSWSLMSIPGATGNGAALNDVEVITADDVWVVGSASEGTLRTGIEFVPLIAHYDGSAWTIAKTPPLTGDFVSLSAVDAAASDDVWVVGAAGTSKDGDTVALHYDGSAWERVMTPNASAPISGLNGVMVTGSDDVWAVGHSGSIEKNQPLIEHWDGSEWNMVESPAIDAPQAVLGDVSAISASDAWAVGSQGPYATGEPLVEHWDGTSWNVVDLEVDGGGLVSVLMVAPDDVWAVGSSGSTKSYHSLLQHWDGETWTEQDLPDTGSTKSDDLSGLAASEGHLWAVGRVLVDKGAEPYGVGSAAA